MVVDIILTDCIKELCQVHTLMLVKQFIFHTAQ